MPDFSLENELQQHPVAGVDEAGRGPWAGPVVAAAVILKADNIPDGIDDSKSLSGHRREVLFTELQQAAVCAVGIAGVEEIDNMNILAATMLAMHRAISSLATVPRYALIDGNRLPQDLPCPAQAVVKGDSRSLSIAAASIIAKVTRDRIMTRLAQDYPAYGWEHNSGYGTKAHKEAIAAGGITPYHRKSFAPVRKYMENMEIA